MPATTFSALSAVPAANAPDLDAQRAQPAYAPAATPQPPRVRTLLIGRALAFLTLFLLVPLLSVFAEAFKKGWQAYLAAITEPDALSAIRLTLLTAVIAVPLNLVFGIAASWCIAKFGFRGKSLLLTLIDLPFLVRTVVPGRI